MTPGLAVLGAGRRAARIARRVAAAAAVVATMLVGACTSVDQQDPTPDGSPRPPTAGAGAPGEAFDRAVIELRDDIEPYRDLVPGGMLLVRHGEELETFTWGLANIRARTPMRLTAPFPIASITKTMVAVRVLQLIEDGRLGVDDTVQTWLPGLVPGGDQITVEQLLSHRSGLPGPDELPRRWTLSYDWNRADLAQALRAHPELRDPGHETDYSNAGYLVLGCSSRRSTRTRCPSSWPNTCSRPRA